jgi:hypothetical protein
MGAFSLGVNRVARATVLRGWEAWELVAAAALNKRELLVSVGTCTYSCCLKVFVAFMCLVNCIFTSNFITD